jgi:predicted kinase
MNPAYLSQTGDASPGSSRLRQHLFLLCGLPFSGKSTLGRALQKRLGIVHVEVDRFHREGRNELVERSIERADWIAAYQEAYRKVESALDQGQSVVFDAVSYRRTQRDRIRRIAAKHDVPMTTIYLDVPPEEARTRLQANRNSPARANVSKTDFDEVAAGMQPPQDDEPVVRYRPDEPVDIWIERVISPMLRLDES